MQSFLTALIECSVAMSVLLLMFIAITPLLSRRYAAKWRYYAWLVIVIGLIIPFRPHLGTAFIQVGTPAFPLIIAQSPPIDAANTNAAKGGSNVPWYQLADCLWLAGAITAIAYHGLKHRRFIRMVNRWSEEITDQQALATLQKLKDAMGISRQVKLQVCSCITSPMMIGFVNPVILLHSTDFSADGLSFILKHELVHFKRKDLWYKSLVLIATAVHWFNPVIYLMARAIAVQCEISCDVEVVKDTDICRRQQYSEVIIGLIKTRSRVQTALSTNFYGGKKDMKNRILSIMDTTKKKAGAVVLCFVLIGTMATGMAFAAASADDNTAIGTATVDDAAGNVSTDGGKTWISKEEYLKMYPDNSFSNVEWYTYDEFKAFVDEQKENLPSYIGATGGYYDDNGVLHKEVWTQEKVDETLANYEKILEDIKNGAKVSKAVKGNDNEMIGYSGIIGNVSTSTTATLDLENGETIDFGTYDTKEECYAAIKAYCDEQVKAGNITQQKADQILSQYK